jgi:hypothetical protein
MHCYTCYVMTNIDKILYVEFEGKNVKPEGGPGL